MASLYKKPVVVKDSETGKRTKTDSKKWWGRYRDEFGQDKRVPLAADKRAAQKMLERIVGKVERTKAGLIDPTEAQMKHPIGKHLKAYEKHLKSKNNTPQYIEESIVKISRIIAVCRWRKVGEITITDVEGFLTDLREIDGLSVCTSNHYLRAIKGFASWLVANERLHRNPLVGIKALNIQTDRRHDRRPLSDEEFSRLIETARTGPPVHGLTGPDRAMLYILAAWTGLRRGELGSLRASSFQLDATPPTVTVEAAYSKHRRKDEQVLHPSVAQQVKAWMDVESNDDILFPISKATCGTDRPTAKMLQRDLESARNIWIGEAKDDSERCQCEKSDFLRYKNSKGLYADFHAMRHTFITNLCRANVSPKTAQALARHSDIRLTMNTYTHIDQQEQAEAIGKLKVV